MSIPKVIHFCWFGNNQKSDLNKRCIESWKKHCSGYKIIEWNEESFSIEQCPDYVKDAYRLGKWAFVSDYARLKIVYNYGGVYLDTDVELLKSLDELLEYGAFFGFENKEYIGTGIGFGAEKEALILKELMEDYNNISFLKPNGSINYTACPQINTPVFLRHGLIQNNKRQILDGSILILPTEYLCPVNYHTERLRLTKRTISIHWFTKSWMTEESKKFHEVRKKEVRRDFWVHLPNRFLITILGKERYTKIKYIIKRQ